MISSVDFDLDRHPITKRMIIWITLLLLMVFVFFPTFWIVSTSLKSNDEAFDTPPTWISAAPTIENYLTQLNDRTGFVVYARNGFLVSALTAITTIILSVPAGYALARIKFKGRRFILFLILASQMFPAVIIVIALFSMYQGLSLIDTYQGLVLAFSSFSLPFAIWMMQGFCRSIPLEIEEAAFVDGSSRVGILFRIVLPLIGPGLVAVGLFSFLNAWNNLLFALSLTISNDMRTIPPGFLMTYVGEFQYKWADMFAGAVLVSIPIVILFILLQRFLVNGLTVGAVKG
jgi:multiple sugar transport system permease protein